MLAIDAQSNGGPTEDPVVKHVRDLEAWYSAEFERRLSELTEILNAQLQSQIQELRAHYEHLSKAGAEAVPPDAILEEIKRNEGVVQKCASDLDRMVGDDTVSLGVLLQLRNQQLELKAYLRGLRFCAEGVLTPRSSSTESDLS
jgi:hypothetical protein